MIGVIESKISNGLKFNTFIGGISSYAIDISTLALTLGVKPATISEFEIVGNDVMAKIDVAYKMKSQAFYNSSVTYFFDYEGKCKELGLKCFQSAKYLSKCYFPSVHKVGNTCFYGTKISHFSIPKINFLGDAETYNNVFETSNIAKAFLNNSIVNDTDYTELSDTALLDEVVIVKNNQKPAIIKNLSEGRRFATGVELNFPIPPSINEISYYEILIDGKPHQTSVSPIVTNLKEDTSYLARIRAVDIYENRSHFSQEIRVKTVTKVDTPTPTVGLLAFIGLDEIIGNPSEPVNNLSTTFNSGMRGGVARVGLAHFNGWIDLNTKSLACGKGAFSVCFWYRKPKIIKNSNLFILGAWSNGYFIRINTSTNVLGFTTQAASRVDGEFFNPDYEWHFYIAEYDGTMMRMWQDNQKHNNEYPQSGNIATPSENEKIGRVLSYDIQGAISKVFYYDRALAPEEKSFLWNKGRGITL